MVLFATGLKHGADLLRRLAPPRPFNATVVSAVINKKVCLRAPDSVGHDIERIVENQSPAQGFGAITVPAGAATYVFCRADMVFIFMYPSVSGNSLAVLMVDVGPS